MPYPPLLVFHLRDPYYRRQVKTILSFGFGWLWLALIETNGIGIYWLLLALFDIEAAAETGITE